MSKLIFTEEYCQPEKLYPFTLTRKVQDIRVGILTIREKWERLTGMPSFDKKEQNYKYLHGSINMDDIASDDVCFIINASVLPTVMLVKAMRALKNGEMITSSAGNPLVYRVTQKETSGAHKKKVYHAVTQQEQVKILQYPWEIFQLNDWAIRQDFKLLTHGRKSQPITKSNRVRKTGQIFIEKGAKVAYSIINAETGPVYIGRNAEVMEGCYIRGPFAMGEGSCLKMGAKVYGATTLGPGCVAGGEIKNTVMMGFSNKAHDGYIGDSVIGEWCNLGAGTTNSNIKNNASCVKIWTISGEMDAVIKCGVFIGDYTRTAINTAINTGTVIGVSCNVFGIGLTPRYVPNFSWGSDGITRYELEKALTDIDNWKKLKGQSLTEEERRILTYIYEKF